MVLAACAPVQQSDTASRALAMDSELPPMKTFAARSPARPSMANADIARDFLDLSFQMESGRQLERFTRFEGPISLRVTGQPPKTLRGDLDQLLVRLRREAGIDIVETRQPGASITVEAVPSRAIQSVLPQAACFVAPNVSSLQEFRSARRSPRTNWATLYEREKIAIFVPSDASPQEIRDCLHEELAQALGPLNDLYHLPNSVFNDDNVHTVLTGFDMLILRITYDPALLSGMSRADVTSRLPDILARINPSGNRPGKGPVSPTPLGYVQAIQTALGPGASMSDRRTAADEALRIAVSRGWTDNRRAFAHYAKGRLLQTTSSVAAQDQFLLADRFYANSPDTKVHRAYVATQLSAYALSQGDPAKAERIARAHIKSAEKLQNAALLATLQLLRAESLEALGRGSEAQRVRADTLGWARYGFGADWVVESKLREIAALNPSSPPV